MHGRQRRYIQTDISYFKKDSKIRPKISRFEYQIKKVHTDIEIDIEGQSI